MMANATAIGIEAGGFPDFEEMVRANQSRVFSIAYHFLHDRAVAEEIAQDVFLKLYKALPSLQSETHITAWLCKVTGNRCIDYARSRRKYLSLDEIPEPATEAAPGDPIMAGRLRRMVASLPAKARIVVVLRYQEDMEPEEIARVLGWRLNTVKSQLYRSLTMLRNKLGRSSGEVES
ncbi:MAG: sigma-70 family RNA polymerase sigma factor [Acidobacteria bacterium]|nr:sigma-70 family RNA polymerase sigma factor [Acidobacteriota bacterium]